MAFKKGFLALLLFGNANAQCPVPTLMQPIANSTSIRFSGDIVLSNKTNYFDDVGEYLKSADLMVGNLEGTLTNHTKNRKSNKQGSSYSFRASPTHASLLKEQGFDVLNIANNHSYDFFEIGYQDTKENLTQTGIAVTGLKDEITWINIKNLNVAIIGFGFYDYQNRIQDLHLVETMVSDAKLKGAHYVIVTFHGGAEGDNAIIHHNKTERFLGEDRGNSVAFSRTAIEAGADLVIGHGPHVLRSIECYNNKPIFYSMGNFVSSGGLSVHGKSAISAIGGINLDDQGRLVGIELLPITFNQDKTPKPDNEYQAIKLLNKLAENTSYEADFLKIKIDESNKY